LENSTSFVVGQEAFKQASPGRLVFAPAMGYLVPPVMKIPSLSNLIREAWRTFARFPVTLISACIGVVCLLILAEGNSQQQYDFLWRFVLPASLGLPLFTVAEVFCDKHNLSVKLRWVLRSAGTVFLVLYTFTLPTVFHNAPYDYLVRYALLSIGLHFLVAFLPFADREQVNGFWQYNKVLFLRFLTSALYSAVLYLGLVIALVATKELFDFSIRDKRFLQLFVAIAGVFNTCFFLAGIPEKPATLNEDSSYPKGLKIFTQYILLPLVVVYLGILYAYEIKIVLAWSWPKGWVSHLVLWFSVVGILGLLLVHPVRELAENRWVRTFSKWFFAALVPLVAMLLLSILRRISDYGITPNRYFVLVQAWALALVVAYFMVSKRKDIRIIPQILCFLAFFSSFGPWGALSLSRSSQTGRLMAILTHNQILVDGKIQRISHAIPFEQQKEISSIIDYLLRIHGVESLSMWFEDSLDSLGGIGFYNGRDSVLQRMGVEYIPEWQRPDASVKYFHLSAEKSGTTVADVSQYDYYVESNLANDVKRNVSITGSAGLELELLPKLATFRIIHKDAAPDTLDLNLTDFVKSMVTAYNNRMVPDNKMVLEISHEEISAKLMIDYIGGEREEAVEVNQLGFRLFLKLGSHGE
jgi:hypothetical protein